MDVSHSFPGGIPHRFLVPNWTPVGGTGSGFWFGASLRLRYYPPSSSDFTLETVKVVDDAYLRGQWNWLFAEVLVPPNTGGTCTAVLMPAEGAGGGIPDTTYWGSRWGLFRQETFTAVNYERGDMVSAAERRLIEYLAYPGDDPYRAIVTSGPDPDSADGVPAIEDIAPAPGTKRIQYRYVEDEHHNAWDTALAMARDGGVHVWFDVGATERVFRCGDRGQFRPEYPLGIDNPRGYLTSWTPDASKAASRTIVQGTGSDWPKVEGVAFGANIPTGALVDRLETAPATIGNVDLYSYAEGIEATRGGTPQIMQWSLPGDAAHSVVPGDRFLAYVEIVNGKPYKSAGRLHVATSVAPDEDRDRTLIETTDMVAS
jgi:hypothetical protein